jgi:catechol 2,3-dioxygenase-like lactoylglutathione lyase family enzyme
MKRPALPQRLIAAIATLPLLASGARAGARNESIPKSPFQAHGLVASNAFFYYADLARATRFYTDVIGLRIVADYGYAKILQVAPTSFLTLVDAAKGMHAADEPKTVALALVTEDLDAWNAHLSAWGVPYKHPYRGAGAGSAHDGFVVIDPEGYFLEFERFNPHPENQRLLPLLAKLEPLPASPTGTGERPAPRGLSLRATVLWLYYRDLAAAQRFYEHALGFDLLVDQGWAKVHANSASGFLGLVDESRGMHRATEKKGVTASFWTAAVDRWYDRVEAGRLFELRSKEVHLDPEGRYRAFVGYDPEGYFLEFDTFREHPQNEALLRALAASQKRR